MIIVAFNSAHHPRVQHDYEISIGPSKHAYLEASWRILIRKHSRVRDRIFYWPSLKETSFLGFFLAVRLGSEARRSRREAFRAVREVDVFEPAEPVSVSSFSRHMIPFHTKSNHVVIRAGRFLFNLVFLINRLFWPRKRPRPMP